MRTLALFCILLASTVSSLAWTVGDVVYLKSGSPPMTVTEVLPNTNVGTHWFAGSTMLAATFPENALMIETPSPKIAAAEAVIAARDNPPVKP